MTTVCVVIPTYQPGTLLNCLAGVFGGKVRPDHVVVVDNASTDGSIEEARQSFPTVEFIQNAENVGFGSACNQGIELGLSRGVDYVFLLNQDAEIAADALESMIGLAERQSRVGVVGSRTLLGKATSTAAPKLLYNGSYRTWLPLWQRIPGCGQPDNPADDEPREVDIVWGHAMLLKSAALRAVGLFDSGFFMYYEDVDLCQRMQQAGWQCWCDSQAITWHDIDDGARASHSEDWRWHLKQSSSRYFYRKHYPRFRGAALWLLTGFREFASLLRHGHGKAAWHLVRAMGKVVAGCPEPRPGVRMV